MIASNFLLGVTENVVEEIGKRIK